MCLASILISQSFSCCRQVDSVSGEHGVPRLHPHITVSRVAGKLIVFLENMVCLASILISQSFSCCRQVDSVSGEHGVPRLHPHITEFLVLQAS